MLSSRLFFLVHWTISWLSSAFLWVYCITEVDALSLIMFIFVTRQLYYHCYFLKWSWEKKDFAIAAYHQQLRTKDLENLEISKYSHTFLQLNFTIAKTKVIPPQLRQSSKLIVVIIHKKFYYKVNGEKLCNVCNWYRVEDVFYLLFKYSVYVFITSFVCVL